MTPGALDEGDHDFLMSMQGLGDATIHDLCEATAVTPTAVRQRLMRLQAQGLVSRVSERIGRGRPHHRYRLTDVGRSSLGDNYAELAVLLWQEFLAIEDPAVRNQLRQRLQSRFVERLSASVQGKSVADRMQQLGDALRSKGFHTEVRGPESQLESGSNCAQAANGDRVVLREWSCPYHELTVENDEICSLERDVFQQVIGVPLKLVQSCRDGASCCEFEAEVDSVDH